MSRRRFLVTAALPYSNGRLHVGHIAGAYLPADTYVRYLRATGADVRFICGSDDNGVAAIKTAREQNRRVEELTAYYNASQQAGFKGLGIEFDIYGGTHQPGFVALHEQLSQEFFLKIHAQGLFTKRTTRQLYDSEAQQFLPDRFVKGTCPQCGSPNAFGDQCEGCGRSLEALELLNPVSVMTGATPVPRETVHWYLRLDRMEDELRGWLASKRDAWRTTVTNFALGQMTPALNVTFASAEQVKEFHPQLPKHTGEPLDADRRQWRLVFESRVDRDASAKLLAAGGVSCEVRGGLPERAMTRDLAWGVPVPLDDPDAKNKVLYVWFDAPIGYVSFTAQLCEQSGQGWRAYEHWWKSPDCRVVHFIGEDNTVFHALTWPAMMLATHDSGSVPGEAGEYQLPFNVVANSFLNIKFPGKDEEKISKSRGTAVWIEDYLRSFDPDPLRYYLTAIAPETQRTAWDFDDFVARNNGELGNALGNFVNRTMTFAHKYFDGKVPQAGTLEPVDHQQLARCRDAVTAVGDELEHCRFKSALGLVMQLARDANGYFDATAPFRSRKTDLAACGRAINICLQTVKTLTTLIGPFLPFSAAKCLAMLRLDASALQWTQATTTLPAGAPLGEPVILFKKLELADLLGD